MSNIGGGNGNWLQYSCLENSMDREGWWATVHGVTKSQTRLSNWARPQQCARQLAGDRQRSQTKTDRRGPCFHWNWAFPWDHLCLLLQQHKVQKPLKCLLLLSYHLGNFKMKINASVLTIQDSVHRIFSVFQFSLFFSFFLEITVYIIWH